MKSEAANRPGRQLVDRQTAARYLGVRSGTLAVWASTKRYPLPYYRVGRSVRYDIADLDAFLDRRTVGAVDERGAT